MLKSIEAASYSIVLYKNHQINYLTYQSTSKQSENSNRVGFGTGVFVMWVCYLLQSDLRFSISNILPVEVFQRWTLATHKL